MLSKVPNAGIETTVFEDSLGDEHGDEVKLKKGTWVEVTVTTKDANGHN